MAQLNFDASQIAPDSGSMDPVPKGWYNVVIDSTDMKPTSKGDGMFLLVSHTIVDGQFSGRKVFARINIRNPNQQAQEIGYKQLSAICHAVGVIQVQDSSQLHNIPLKIRVKVRKDDTGQYDDQNDITAWKNINEPVQTGPSTPTSMPTFAPPAAQVNPPQFHQPPVQQWQAPAAPAVAQQPIAPPQAPQQQWQPPAAAQPWQQAPQFAPPAAQEQQQAPQFAPPPQATQTAQAPAQAPAALPWASAQQATPPWHQPQ